MEGISFNRLDQAIKFSALAHRGQKRKGTDLPYHTHPFAVALLILISGGSEDQVIAGLLHDLVEDTAVTAFEIRAIFGEKVEELVLACSEDLEKEDWGERKQATLDYLLTASSEVKLVACADKLHNLRSISGDYAEIGELVWDRFKRGRVEQAWYYRSLANILCPDLGCEAQGGIYRTFREETEFFFGRLGL